MLKTSKSKNLIYIILNFLKIKQIGSWWMDGRMDEYMRAVGLVDGWTGIDARVGEWVGGWL